MPVAGFISYLGTKNVGRVNLRELFSSCLKLQTIFTSKEEVAFAGKFPTEILNTS